MSIFDHLAVLIKDRDDAMTDSRSLRVRIATIEAERDEARLERDQWRDSALEIGAAARAWAFSECEWIARTSAADDIADMIRDRAAVAGFWGAND